MRALKLSHCSWCGAAYAPEQPWPRTCASCNKTTYRNPIPVAVVLLPVAGGLLTIRRDIEPRRGELALPGGYVELGETWQQAGARELREETGVTIDASELRERRVLSGDDGTLLVFGVAHERDRMPQVQTSAETSEIVLIDSPRELAFPLHTLVVREWFGR
ncbi:MAG: NUDIX domain-containing protein [Planctomycetota bacterium]